MLIKMHKLNVFTFNAFTVILFTEIFMVSGSAQTHRMGISSLKLIKRDSNYIGNDARIDNAWIITESPGD